MSEQTSNTIDLNRIYEILKKNLWGILFWAIGGAITALIISFFFITPKYSSTLDLLVNQKVTDTQAQYTAQQADLQAINTYKDVLKKSIILEPVLKKVRESDNYKGTLSDLQNSVSISNQTNSQVLSVTVTNSNAYVATDIANEIGTTFTKKIKKMMKVDNVTVVNKATVNTNPVSPNKKLNILIGLIVGIIVGVIIALIRGLLDTTVKDSKFLTDDLGLVNLGFVYHISHENQDYHVAEILSDSDDDSEDYKRV